MTLMFCIRTSHPSDLVCSVYPLPFLPSLLYFLIPCHAWLHFDAWGGGFFFLCLNIPLNVLQIHSCYYKRQFRHFIFPLPTLLTFQICFILCTSWVIHYCVCCEECCSQCRKSGLFQICLLRVCTESWDWWITVPFVEYIYSFPIISVFLCNLNKM